MLTFYFRSGRAAIEETDKPPLTHSLLFPSLSAPSLTMLRSVVRPVVGASFAILVSTHSATAAGLACSVELSHSPLRALLSLVSLPLPCAKLCADASPACSCNVLAMQAVILMIPGEATSSWYKCDGQGQSATFSTTKLTSGGESISLCESALVDHSNVFKVACNAGRAGIGLGVVALLLTTIGAIFSVLLATSLKRAAFWGAALGLQVTGGILALAGGIGYIAAMQAEASHQNLSSSCSAQAGPILLLVGEYSTQAGIATKQHRHPRDGKTFQLSPTKYVCVCVCVCVCSGGIFAIAASSLHCVCCCADKDTAA